jgi:hypothetical protein
VASLVLGPIVRYVDERVATIWVQTGAACEVEVLGARERTWCVAGLHFAIIVVTGLEPGIDHPYEVRLDGTVAWPEPGSSFPQSTVRLLAPGARRDIVFGSCRITRPHEPPYTLRADQDAAGQGIDALRAYALRAAHAGGAGACPDMLLMLGDQIYADQPSPELKRLIAGRERPADAPEDELADFAEYALTYEEAWSEPAIRWLLSTVPVTMIFDDHEIHAEWRISQGWLDEMNAEPWFDRHIRAGLMAYWVFQHVGNLSPDAVSAGGLLDELRATGDGGELLASRMSTEGKQTGHSRWSYARDLGGARLVVIDSRAGRRVEPGRRALVQEEEWDWIREQASAPARHLILASSVPFLLAPALHHVEAFDEALTDGSRGRVGAWFGEKLRRIAVLDHWASFQQTFRALIALLDDIAHGRVGDAPRTIVMVSGDVHHCYLAEVGFPRGSGPRSHVWQAVCSAFRKELAPYEQRVIAVGHSRIAERFARMLARRVGVPPLPLNWRVVEEPAFGNQIATLTIDGESARVSVEQIAGEDWHDPRLALAFARDLS